MKLLVFSIFDDKAGCYMPPFFSSAVGQAVRSFGDLVNNKETMVGMHPEDFRLFQLGDFDDGDGRLSSLDVTRLVAVGLDFVSKDVSIKGRLKEVLNVS